MRRIEADKTWCTIQHRHAGGRGDQGFQGFQGTTGAQGPKGEPGHGKQVESGAHHLAQLPHTKLCMCALAMSGEATCRYILPACIHPCIHCCTCSYQPSIPSAITLCTLGWAGADPCRAVMCCVFLCCAQMAALVTPSWSRDQLGTSTHPWITQPRMHTCSAQVPLVTTTTRAPSWATQSRSEATASCTAR